jgi:Cys-tRNA(Pro)/Cys-tRNA(Cys) deacylase
MERNLTQPARDYSPAMAGKGTPATHALDRAGIVYCLHAYEHGGADSIRSKAGYGIEAAEMLGLDPGRVFKTLLAMLDGRPVVGVLPVSTQLDLKALAAALSGKKATMADPADAERLTGYVVGGISPIGQKRRLSMAIDTSAQRHETIFVSAGRRGLEVELTADDLARGTGAVFATLVPRVVPRPAER